MIGSSSDWGLDPTSTSTVQLLAHHFGLRGLVDSRVSKVRTDYPLLSAPSEPITRPLSRLYGRLPPSSQLWFSLSSCLP